MFWISIGYLEGVGRDSSNHALRSWQTTFFWGHYLLDNQSNHLFYNADKKTRIQVNYLAILYQQEVTQSYLHMWHREKVIWLAMKQEGTSEEFYLSSAPLNSWAHDFSWKKSSPDDCSLFQCPQLKATNRDWKQRFWDKRNSLPVVQLGSER